MLFFLALMSACAGGASALEKARSIGKAELAGFSSSIPSIVWRDNSAISISYKLQWGNPNGSWILNRREPVNISFWDTKSKVLRRVAIEVKSILLSQNFLYRADKTMTANIEVSVPPNATAVSVALGTSGLETDRVPIPHR
jgi:hypothetical protein